MPTLAGNCMLPKLFGVGLDRRHLRHLTASCANVRGVRQGARTRVAVIWIEIYKLAYVTFRQQFSMVTAMPLLSTPLAIRLLPMGMLCSAGAVAGRRAV